METSIATLSNPEFINVVPYNPLLSECEIKVLYLGKNRNNTYIDKEAATKLAASLPGSPIVGFYSSDEKDFVEHSKRITFQDGEITFEDLTKPIGFVDLNAKMWFKEFEEFTPFGESVIRTYLMTTGVLWTGVYEEAQRIIDRGNNQSMELWQESLDGNWAKDIKTGVEFFIINDGLFSKLCVLGEEVEPCFEGASIKRPDVSIEYCKNKEEFFETLKQMSKQLELSYSLKNQGGQKMSDINTPIIEPIVEPIAEPIAPIVEPIVDPIAPIVEPIVETIVEPIAPIVEPVVEPIIEPVIEPIVEPIVEPVVEPIVEPIAPIEFSAEEHDKLKEELDKLKSDYALLEEQNKALTEFKNSTEIVEKEALVDTFYMLAEEDLKDVKENISTYSLEDIEAKLSVICRRKKVNFALSEEDKNDNKLGSSITTFNLNGASEQTKLPAWVIKAKEAQK